MLRERRQVDHERAAPARERCGRRCRGERDRDWPAVAREGRFEHGRTIWPPDRGIGGERLGASEHDDRARQDRLAQDRRYGLAGAIGQRGAVDHEHAAAEPRVTDAIELRRPEPAAPRTTGIAPAPVAI